MFIPPQPWQLFERVTFSLLWPAYIFILLCSWVVYLGYILGWFIFAGGIAKSLGLA